MKDQQVLNRLERAVRSREALAQRLQRRADQYLREAESMRETQRVLAQRAGAQRGQNP